MNTNEWYTIVGTGQGPRPARGPHKGLQEAQRAVTRFCMRYGAEAGAWLNSGNVRIVGPCRTREEARKVNISEYSFNSWPLFKEA